MQRELRTALALAVLVGAAASWVWAATRIPARDTLRDAATDRIRSDGLGTYEDGNQCVGTWVQSSYFFLRTYSATCFNAAIPPERGITLDFSDAVSRTPDGSGSDSCHVDDALVQLGELDICGSNELPDVRIIASSLFAKTASTRGTPVSLPFNLVPNFKGLAFELDFEGNQQVFGIAGMPNVRELEAASLAIAELYKVVPGGSGGTRISLGRYQMPFRLRVEKLQ